MRGLPILLMEHFPHVPLLHLFPVVRLTDMLRGLDMPVLTIGLTSNMNRAVKRGTLDHWNNQHTIPGGPLSTSQWRVQQLPSLPTWKRKGKQQPGTAFELQLLRRHIATPNR